MRGIWKSHETQHEQTGPHAMNAAGIAFNSLLFTGLGPVHFLPVHCCNNPVVRSLSSARSPIALALAQNWSLYSGLVAFVVASHRESFPWASARITAISTEYQPRRHIKDEALGGLSGERLLELIGKISMWGCHSLVSITRSSELSLHCQFKALRQMIGSNEDFGKVWTSPQARRCGEKQIDHPSPPLSRLASLGLLVDSLRGEKARNIDLIWSAWILVRFLS
ncbi:hypothetical protein Ae201684_006450 [Aphanomyces euteiches]|uniref:Uncharacterized protein n=1 Tax=Aphanomyces euteiches TaxID=100861 RepID=A0A6G0XAT7_9STRA|nr:hypothetical protein Ae201684_006450 [Aphanomyces euteiches]